MADASFAVTSFLGGEFSQRMQGRFDRPDYRTAMNVCLNSFPIETGAWVRRPGTQFAGTTRNGNPGRILNFDFYGSAPYSIEMTDSFLRFRNGAAFISTNDNTAITSISTANPAVVQLSSPVTWSTGDQVVFKLLGTVCPLLQNRQFILTKIDTTHFSIADNVTTAGIDGSTLGVGSIIPGASTLSRILAIGTPYNVNLLSSTRVVLADIAIATGTTPGAFFLNASVAPWLLQVATQPTTLLAATFTFAAASLQDGPYLDPVTTGETLTLTVVSGSIGTPGSSVTITASGSTFGGFVATDVGRLIRIFDEPPLWLGGFTYSAADIVTYPVLGQGGPYWVALTTTTGVPPGTDPTKWGLLPTSNATARWIWATITAYSSATVVTATIEVGGLVYPKGGSPVQGAYVVWRLGVYSQTTGWPSVGTFHEGRLWLAGAVANRIDGSASNNVLNFAPTALDGTVADNNAISYVFNAPDVNPIYWMIPDLQGIICGTKSGEWLVQSPTTGGITPTNIAARRVTKIGCANVEPRRTEHTIAFVQKFSRKVMEYFADIFSGKFTAPHLTFTCKHLTIGGVQEIAYQQELSPTVWMRLNGNTINGTSVWLAGITYKRDTLMTSQGPTIAAGHRHVLGSGRDIESMATCGSVDGTLDALTMVTNDQSSHVRHVEILTNIMEEGTALGSAWYLDDAVAPSSTTTTNTPSVGAPYGGMTLNGLWHLNGNTVQVFAGGLDCGNVGDNKTTFSDFTVTNGSVFVPYGDGVSAGSGAGLFTSSFAAIAAAAGQIVIGFTYNSDGQIVRPQSPQETGARNGPGFAKEGRAQEFGLQVENTAFGLMLGTTFTKMDHAKFKGVGGSGSDSNMGVGVTANGIFRQQLRGTTETYSFDSRMMCWRMARPLPANIVAVGEFGHTQDR